MLRMHRYCFPQETHLLKQLSDSEFSVPYHGSFANGRIEGWTTLRSLNPEEMSIFDGPVDFAGLIAGQMAAMHALTPDEPGNPDREPQLWPVTQGWAETAATLRFDDSSARAALYARVDIPHMIEELHWLMRVLPIPAAEESAPIAAAQKFAFASVFCHNDVLSGNVMVDEVTGQCQLIDFEYGSYNFRAFDIANHFCEYSGFDGDWGKWHPTNAQMLRFLRAYVRQSPEGAAVLEGLADEAAREMFMQELLKWTALFCLASHLWWGFWCIIQARYSPIDFDFLDYGRIRFVGYFYHKGLYARYLFSHEGAK